MLEQDKADADKQAEMEVRSLTGIGAKLSLTPAGPSGLRLQRSAGGMGAVAAPDV